MKSSCRTLTDDRALPRPVIGLDANQPLDPSRAPRLRSASSCAERSRRPRRPVRAGVGPLLGRSVRRPSPCRCSVFRTRLYLITRSGGWTERSEAIGDRHSRPVALARGDPVNGRVTPAKTDPARFVRELSLMKDEKESLVLMLKNCFDDAPQFACRAKSNIFVDQVCSSGR